jgi:CheY-like chemotaxis protein
MPRCCIDRTILVVEDNAEIRESMRDVLEIEGYKVVTADNGKAALEALEECGVPCLILLDLMMPVMSGGEFLGALRRDAARAAIPVVIVSAWPQEAAQLAALVQGFVKKPTPFEAIMHWVEKFCDGEARARASALPA